MKKIIKRFITAVLVMSMFCIISSTSAFAEETNSTGIETRAGVETWVYGNHWVGEFNMTNTNMTPQKTMGTSGHLIVYGVFNPNDNIGNLALDITIYNRTNGTSSTRTYEHNSGHVYAVDMNVHQGDVLQIYFDAHTASGHSNPSGAYRKANVTLNYSLT